MRNNSRHNGGHRAAVETSVQPVASRSHRLTTPPTTVHPDFTPPLDLAAKLPRECRDLAAWIYQSLPFSSSDDILELFPTYQACLDRLRELNRAVTRFLQLLATTNDFFEGVALREAESADVRSAELGARPASDVERVLRKDLWRQAWAVVARLHEGLETMQGGAQIGSVVSLGNGAYRVSLGTNSRAGEFELVGAQFVPRPEAGDSRPGVWIPPRVRRLLRKAPDWLMPDLELLDGAQARGSHLDGASVLALWGFALVGWSDRDVLHELLRPLRLAGQGLMGLIEKSARGIWNSTDATVVMLILAVIGLLTAGVGVICCLIGMVRTLIWPDDVVGQVGFALFMIGGFLCWIAGSYFEEQR